MMREILRTAAEYPSQLLPLKGGPDSLFVRGNIEALTKPPLISVVGTRKVTPYGQAVVRQMVPIWARAGITIVSGLALGTDALAHQATLDAGGTTVAVLGSGIDNPSITPRTNYLLGQKILERGGALVTEYPPGTPADAFRFPERNRIVAGLAQALVVIEGSMKSGTLITAKCMLEYGREVFAVPGPITVETSRGPNWLISQGAYPLLQAEDLLDYLGLKQTASDSAKVNLSPSAMEIFQQLKLSPATADQLAESLGLDTSVVLTAISELELSGAAFRSGDAYTPS
ncbi:MAG: DNA-processing protein DprA [Patescibacteria group bacterium]